MTKIKVGSRGQLMREDAEETSFATATPEENAKALREIAEHLRAKRCAVSDEATRAFDAYAEREEQANE